MKIILTGGGTGGHFYPIIAVAEKLNQLAKDNRLLKPELYYMSTDPYDENLLFENSITFYKVSAGKIRRDKTPENIVKNFFDLFKTFSGVMSALWRVFVIYPDVVFGKGGYASFPVLFAARFLGIPVVIHESDSKPGKVNAWAGKFARRVAVSYPDAASFFKKEITAYTGNPVRKAIQEKQVSGSHEFFGFNKDIKTVFIIGGSLGSRFINSSIMDALSELVENYQVIHQTGKDNYPIIEETSKVILNGNKNKDRYKAFPYMNDLAMRMASGAADVIISRAGSAVFEIALWGRASILVPIPEETSHDQRTNAYSYARSGACVVIEEKNMSTGVLMSEIERVTAPNMKEQMEQSAKSFSRIDSAQLIAEGILAIGLEHEK